MYNSFGQIGLFCEEQRDCSQKIKRSYSHTKRRIIAKEETKTIVEKKKTLLQKKERSLWKTKKETLSGEKKRVLQTKRRDQRKREKNTIAHRSDSDMQVFSLIQWNTCFFTNLLVHCECGPYAGRNETGMGDRVRRCARNWLSTALGGHSDI